MASNVTLADLKTRSREAADMVGSTFIEDAELTRYINASAQELYDLLVAAYGQEYYLDEFNIPIVSGTDTYALPTDFYQLLGVDLLLDANGNEAVTLKPYMLSERNKYNNSYVSAYASDSTVRAKYRLQNGNIKLIPEPSGGYSLNIIYIPAMTLMVSDVDTLDGVNGWEEYIVLDTAIKMGRKEETDVSVLTFQKNELLKRIESLAGKRDAGFPEVVGDVSATNGGGFSDGIY